MPNIYQRFQKLKQTKTWEAYDQLRDIFLQQKILQSGDPELVADYFRAIDEPETTVTEHFGESSLEQRAYQLYSPSISPEKEYKVPKRTEDPTVTAGTLKRWILDFCRANDLSLPTGFHSRNRVQLLGMFHGMLKHYHISVEEIVHTSD